MAKAGMKRYVSNHKDVLWCDLKIRSDRSGEVYVSRAGNKYYLP